MTSKSKKILHIFWTAAYIALLSIPAQAQTLWLPSTSDARSFKESDAEVIALYEKEDQICQGGPQAMQTFFSCAKRDILAKVLEERDYCRSSECQPGRSHAWKPCGLSFSPMPEKPNSPQQ